MVFYILTYSSDRDHVMSFAKGHNVNFLTTQIKLPLSFFKINANMNYNILIQYA